MSNDSKIRTRIAPSPTGLFHVGTARTALFNYLYAVQNGGEFLVRIEDTDKVRSKVEYEEDILAGLKWLGLNWSGEIVRQSDNASKHLLEANRLVEQGNAYHKDGAIWFKVEPDQEVKFNDLVRGEVSFKTNDLEDFVIVRSSGEPIFYLVGIVDDHDMGITHIIRGEDLLSNTPKQILIAQALGYEPLCYAHLPLILNPDKSKLSKRHGATSLSDYKQDYLPESLINFLSLLGWHPSTDQEFFDLAGLINNFQLNRVSKSGAVFDLAKLKSINNYYIQAKPTVELGNLLKPYRPDYLDDDKYFKVIDILKSRLEKLSDFTNLCQVFGPLTDYSAQQLIFKKSTFDKTLKAIELALVDFQDADFESMVTLEHALAQIVFKNNLTNGDVFWPVRVALSGQEKSPSPVEMLWVLGQAESLRRINLAYDKLMNSQKNQEPSHE